MARDLYHQGVREAIEKEGWTITNDPYYLTTLKVKYEIDLGAEKILAAEKESQKIAIEIKSFSKASIAHEFHSALGQYLNYWGFLKLQEPERILFLAIPEDIYVRFFELESTAYIIDLYKVNLLVYNPEQNTITKWQKA